MELRTVKLPSGNSLTIHPAPFKLAKALYLAVIEETKNVEISSKSDMVGIFRGIFLGGLASPRIDAALGSCLAYAIYNELKIDADTFEKVERREDYPTVCLEVAYENVYPFLKNLSAQYSLMLEKLAGAPK